MTTKTAVIIDCDPGIDDAITLFLAFASPELELLAVTTVAGNIAADLTARNARLVRELAGREDVPVYAGCTGPLVRQPVEAAEFHGASGLGMLPIFEPKNPLAPGHSVEAIIDIVMGQPSGTVTLVSIGPMTNIALALRLEPRLAERLAQVVIMGGAMTEGGNITPYSEFNVHADPHAAHVVFSSGVKTVVFSLDVTHQVRATAPRTEKIAALTSVAGKTCAEMVDFANRVEKELAGGDGTPLHDPCTVVWLLQPELFATRPCRVKVEMCSPEKLGQTVVDFSPAEPANCLWATAGDAEGIFALVTERLSR